MGEAVVRGIIAIALGVGGAYGLFWLGNELVNRFAKKNPDTVRGFVFALPAMFVVGFFLIYPLGVTFRDTFFSDDTVRGEGRSFVGFDNYASVFSDGSTWSALWNNVLWMIFVPLLSVVVGLAAAVLADKLRTRWENTSKSLIFLPMAISFVGASVVWRLVYDIRPAVENQTGILNAIAVNWFGTEPIAWLEVEAINDFALMNVMIWLQAGFAMVLLSAAIKSVPEDTLEAARIDGANEWQVFWRITVPQIRSTIVVVATTILILVLKVFDIVRVLGRGGQFDTDVIANVFYTAFESGNPGTAGVLVMLLVVMTIPFMIINIRRFQEQEELR